MSDERRARRLRHSLHALGIALHHSSLIVHRSSTADAGRRPPQHRTEHRQPVRRFRRAAALLLAAAGLAVLLVLLSYRRKREVAPKAFNHHGKLVKEVSKAIGLKPADLRPLKTKAQALGVSSPLTMLICPSLLSRDRSSG